MFLDDIAGFKQLLKPLHCIVVHLDRDNYIRAGYQRVECKDTQRRRTIYDTDVIAVSQGFELLTEHKLPAAHRAEVELRS